MVPTVLVPIVPTTINRLVTPGSVRLMVRLTTTGTRLLGMFRVRSTFPTLSRVLPQASPVLQVLMTILLLANVVMGTLVVGVGVVLVVVRVPVPE